MSNIILPYSLLKAEEDARAVEAERGVEERRVRLVEALRRSVEGRVTEVQHADDRARVRSLCTALAGRREQGARLTPRECADLIARTLLDGADYEVKT